MKAVTVGQCPPRGLRTKRFRAPRKVALLLLGFHSRVIKEADTPALQARNLHERNKTLVRQFYWANTQDQAGLDLLKWFQIIKTLGVL